MQPAPLGHPHLFNAPDPLQEVREQIGHFETSNTGLPLGVEILSQLIGVNVQRGVGLYSGKGQQLGLQKDPELFFQFRRQRAIVRRIDHIQHLEDFVAVDLFYSLITFSGIQVHQGVIFVQEGNIALPLKKCKTLTGLAKKKAATMRVSRPSPHRQRTTYSCLAVPVANDSSLSGDLRTAPNIQLMSLYKHNNGENNQPNTANKRHRPKDRASRGGGVTKRVRIEESDEEGEVVENETETKHTLLTECIAVWSILTCVTKTPSHQSKNKNSPPPYMKS